MKGIITLLLLIVALAFAQPEEFDQLPPSEISNTGISNDIVTVDHLKEINQKYRNQYKALRDTINIEIRRLDKKGNAVKIILLFAALLPAIGAGINFIEKKWIRYTVSVLALTGTIFSIIGTQYYETDSRGFNNAKRKLVALRCDLDNKYEICLDVDNFFNSQNAISGFISTKSNIRNNMTAILTNIGATKEAVLGIASNEQVNGGNNNKFSIIPSVYAQDVSLAPEVSNVSKNAPYIDLIKGEFINNENVYKLPESFNNKIDTKNFTYIGGVGENSSYENAKENAKESLSKKLHATLKEIVLSKDSTIDSVKLNDIVTQGVEILSKTGETPKETVVKGDDYYYLLVKSYNNKQIDNVMKNILNDAGVDTTSKHLIMGQTKLPVQLTTVEDSLECLKEPKLINTASFKVEKDSTKWYDFTISLDCDSTTLQSIRKVIYNMHPSFRTPIVVKTNRDESFTHSWVGWGVFNLTADIEYRDGSIKKLSHMLTF